MKAQQHPYIIHSFKCKNNFNTIGQLERRFESWGWGFFFFSFVRQMAWPSSTSSLSQIWLQVREDIREKQDSCYVLSKHDEFSFFSPQNMVTLYIILIKKSFVGFALPFFCGQVGKFGPKKIPWLGEQETTTNLAKFYL